MHYLELMVTLVILVLLSAPGCHPPARQGSVVSIEQRGDSFQLMRNGQPYTILGVGGTQDLALLKRYGGNTIRTWDAEGMRSVLDEAQTLGISVMLGIWLEHQRAGFDVTDDHARAEQRARVRRFVLKFRDHPALLAWGVGNELELAGDMDLAIRQINEAAAVIKSLDPNHPTGAVIAEIGDDKAVRIQRACPNIDFIGINSYGGMGSLAQRLDQQGYTGAYAVTEFGPIGTWETGLSSWGAPFEQSSAAKAAFIRDNYLKTIKPNLGRQCLGSFAFVWGSKQEKTETWFGLLLKSGETTESVDTLSALWTGTQVSNHAPHVTGITLDVEPATLVPGQTFSARVDAQDPDGDALSTQWRLMPESTSQSVGGDAEQYLTPVAVQIEPRSATEATIKLPEVTGAYRLFAIVRDGNGHAGTANVPVLITGD